MESTTQLTIDDKSHRETAAPQSYLFGILSGNRRELVFWLLNAVYWALFLGIGLLMTRAVRSEIPNIHLTLLLRVANGFVFTSALRMIYHLPWFRRQNVSAKWMWMLACFAGLGLLEMAFIGGLVGAGVPLPGGLEAAGVRLLLVRMFTLGLWTALYFGFHLFEHQHALEMRAVRAELEAREHELRRLQAQMNPHFIFNALHGVLGCKEDPEGVEEVTRSLIDHLHFLFRDTSDLEPLSRELGALERFLTTQASRSGDGLVCRIYADAGASSVLLPPMTIQPLLEDAFHRRPGSAENPLHIWLTARIEAGCLKLTVSHSGEGPPPAGATPFPAGILALQKRLRLLLGTRAGIERHCDGGWTRTTVTVALAAPN